MANTFLFNHNGKQKNSLVDHHQPSWMKLFFIFLVLVLILSASARDALAFQIDIPLDQALVYSGGESTNLRDYDPATTYSSGDKLVFSGLVAFDPHLNLTPDIA